MIEPSITALGYLEIGVADLAAWQDYAEQVLGVSTQQTDQALHLRMDQEQWRIRLVESGEDDLLCAGFEVSSEADLKAIGARLEGLGIAVSDATAEEKSKRRVRHMSKCTDPDGLPIELYVADNRRLAETPFESPAKASGFVTQDQGLGHMVLAVSDIAAADRFYQEGLGFLVSDYVTMGPAGHSIQVTFLHCNPRHHTLAYVAVPAPKRLNHIMLQANEIDDVGQAYDAASEHGITSISSLGRHTNDYMLSFYMATPSGFEIEYGCGGRKIDDSNWTVEHLHGGSLWGHKRARA